MFLQNQTKWPMQKTHARELDICAWFLNFGNALTVRGIQYVQEKEHQNNCNDHVFLISTQQTLKFMHKNIIYQQQINKNNFLKQKKKTAINTKFLRGCFARAGSLLCFWFSILCFVLIIVFVCTSFADAEHRKLINIPQTNPNKSKTIEKTLKHFLKDSQKSKTRKYMILDDLFCKGQILYFLTSFKNCKVFVSEFCLEALGLPKLNIYVNVLCRLPNCVFSAPNIVFRAAGHALADSLCHPPWQIASLQFLCPNKCF